MADAGGNASKRPHADGEVEEEKRPPRRLRTANTVVDLTGNSDDEQLTVRGDSMGFHLTRLKNAPAAHNQYAIGIQDLLQGEFTSCLLTSYVFDIPWLFGECPRLQDVPIVLVHGERDQHAIAQECRNYTNVTLLTPSLPIPYGTHHTKMMVVIYPTKVRVAIFTANFIPIDWNNKTQGVWHQDFHLKARSSEDGGSGSGDEKSDAKSTLIQWFETDLIDYLSRLGKKVATFCKELRRFDFSSARVALIPSVPGVHKGKDMEKYGHLRVRKLLKVLKVPETDHPLICQFSSMGSLDEKWLFGEFCQSLLPGKKVVPGATSLPVQSFHIIWPSVEDVRNSIEGWNAGRAVPCPLKNMKPFLHKYLRKWMPSDVLHRKNAMPHIKTYARFDPGEERAGALDWAILTSSNLSKAAWGSYQKNQSQFMIRSYELGVIFLPGDLPNWDTKASSLKEIAVIGSKMETKVSHNVKDHQSNSMLLPLPYQFPLQTYNPKRDEPWVWDIAREDPDIFGNCYIPH